MENISSERESRLIFLKFRTPEPEPDPMEQQTNQSPEVDPRAERENSVESPESVNMTRRGFFVRFKKIFGPREDDLSVSDPEGRALLTGQWEAMKKPRSVSKKDGEGKPEQPIKKKDKKLEKLSEDDAVLAKCVAEFRSTVEYHREKQDGERWAEVQPRYVAHRRDLSQAFSRIAEDWRDESEAIVSEARRMEGLLKKTIDAEGHFPGGMPAMEELVGKSESLSENVSGDIAARAKAPEAKAGEKDAEKPKEAPKKSPLEKPRQQLRSMTTEMLERLDTLKSSLRRQALGERAIQERVELKMRDMLARADAAIHTSLTKAEREFLVLDNAQKLAKNMRTYLEREREMLKERQEGYRGWRLGLRKFFSRGESRKKLEAEAEEDRLKGQGKRGLKETEKMLKFVNALEESFRTKREQGPFLDVIRRKGKKYAEAAEKFEAARVEQEQVMADLKKLDIKELDIQRLFSEHMEGRSTLLDTIDKATPRWFSLRRSRRRELKNTRAIAAKLRTGKVRGYRLMNVISEDVDMLPKSERLNWIRSKAKTGTEIGLGLGLAFQGNAVVEKRDGSKITLRGGHRTFELNTGNGQMTTPDDGFTFNLFDDRYDFSINPYQSTYAQAA